MFHHLAEIHVGVKTDVGRPGGGFLGFGVESSAYLVHVNFLITKMKFFNAVLKIIPQNTMNIKSCNA